MPSITPRELESLKSSFLSEISGLKASLSGKEAEVQSLKAAVGDAEKRVGDSLEQVREERNLKNQLAAEKDEWEKRGREMEAILRNVKEEIVHGEREREGLEGRLEESERRREAAEMMAQEAESKMAGMKAGKVCFHSLILVHVILVHDILFLSSPPRHTFGAARSWLQAAQL
jgi:chromosome segregation ATPase